MAIDNIRAIVVQTQENDEPPTSILAFPTPDFPAQTSDYIINALLRTKHEPEMTDGLVRTRNTHRKRARKAFCLKVTAKSCGLRQQRYTISAAGSIHREPTTRVRRWRMG